MAPISLNSQNPALQLQIALAKPGLRDGEATFSHVLETQDAAARSADVQAKSAPAPAPPKPDGAAVNNHPEPPDQTQRTNTVRDGAQIDNVNKQAANAAADAANAATAAKNSAAQGSAGAKNAANAQSAAGARADAAAAGGSQAATVSAQADDASAAANDAPPVDPALADRLASINDKISRLVAAGASADDIADALTRAIADAVAALGDKGASVDAQSKKSGANATAQSDDVLSAVLGNLKDGTGAISDSTFAALQNSIKSRIQSALNDAKSSGDAAGSADITNLLADISQFFARIQRSPDSAAEPPPDVGKSDPANATPEDDYGTRLDADSAKVRSTATDDALLAQLTAFLNGAPQAPATKTQTSGTPAQSAQISDSGLSAITAQITAKPDVLPSALQVPVPSTAAHAALGLADDAKAKKSGSTDSGIVGDDVLRVRTELPRIGTFAQSDALLRTLERAANVANLRETAIDPQSTTLSKIDDALDRLSAKLGQMSTAAVAAASASANSGDTAMNFGSFARFSDGTQALGQITAPGGSGANAQASALNRAADPHDVMGQIVGGIRIGEIGNQSDIRLTLTPAHLGDVTVRLRVGADHSVTAVVMANSAEARQAIVNSGDQLKSALAEAGLKLASLDVNVANRDTSRQAFEDKPQARRPAVGGIGTKSDADEEAPHVYGPSMLDRVNLQLLNQLV